MSMTLAGAIAIGVPFAAGFLWLGWRMLSSVWDRSAGDVMQAPAGCLTLLTGIGILALLIAGVVLEFQDKL